MSNLRPTSAAELIDILRAANAEGRAVEPRGHGSKAAYGGWTSPHTLVDMTALSGVIDYDPAELVLTAWAGTPLVEIEALLAQRRQMLAFEPPYWGGLFGGAPRAGTLGGALAANASGPRRVSHGAARDHLLGFEAVTGGGELFKAGGKVVKNVTGFDLPKLMCGSWGALAVLTQVTVKVLPAGRETATLVLEGLDNHAAVKAMAAALRAPAEVSGAAHRPGWLGGTAATVLRLEGFGPSVTARLDLLVQTLAEFGRGRTLVGEESASLWREVRDGHGLAGPGELWRASVPPAQGADFAAALAGHEAACAFDWGGGLVWTLAEPGEADLEAPVRDAARAMGGEALLARAGPGARAQGAFPAPPPALAALSARVKRAFDPRGVLADRRALLEAG